jgi:uncharacterized protein (TIGR00290 family)
MNIPEMKKKCVFNWSGGKDSALALYKLLQSGDYEVVSLLTTVSSETTRSFMHAIPLSVLRAQAESIGIPFFPVLYDPNEAMSGYETVMRQTVEHFRREGVTAFAFGDIFLEDLRAYRQAQLAPYGIELIEPLWGMTSEEVMRDFLQSGLQTIVVSTMAEKLSEQYIGALISPAFVASLPDEVDVCGENGEYHTLCVDGPIFQAPVHYTLGTPFRTQHTVKLEDGTEQTFAHCFAKIEE